MTFIPLNVDFAVTCIVRKTRTHRRYASNVGFTGGGVLPGEFIGYSNLMTDAPGRGLCIVKLDKVTQYHKFTPQHVTTTLVSKTMIDRGLCTYPQASETVEQ